MSRQRFYLFALLLIAALGVLDAGYLTMTHYSSTPLLCGSGDSCALVTQSMYSAIWGIPVALFGLLFYVVEFVVVFLFLKSRALLLIPLMTLLAVVGVTVSIWLVYVQFALLNAFCPFCMFSALLSFLIALFSGLFEREALGVSSS